MARGCEEEKTDPVRQLKADLKSGGLGTFYVFCGEEAYLRDHYLRAVTEKLLDGPAADFNFHSFTAETLTPQAFSDAVEAMPMMAERTLVRVDDVDLFRLAESQREQYRAVLEDIPDWCCVIFSYDTVEFKVNRTMKKLAEVFQKKAQIVEFKRQSDRELSAWIARHFRAHGKTISDKNCEYLIFLTDGSMTLLGSEIEKAALYASGPEIQKSDIDAVVIPVLNAQTFDISNAIADGDYERALRKVQDLFAMQTEPLMILGAIGSQLRRLLYAKTVMAAGKSQQALCELTGMKSYAAGITMTAARKVSDRFCQRAVELCLEADEQMKRSYDDPRRLLELLITKLSLEARRG